MYQLVFITVNYSSFYTICHYFSFIMTLKKKAVNSFGGSKFYHFNLLHIQACTLKISSVVMNILYDEHYHFLDSCHDRKEG